MRTPLFSALAEIRLQEACQVKNSPSGRVNGPTLRDLPGGLMLTNAPIRAFYRTTTVRFFRGSRVRKVVSARMFKKTAEKKECTS